jgi:hypothetical protein
VCQSSNAHRKYALSKDKDGPSFSPFPSVGRDGGTRGRGPRGRLERLFFFPCAWLACVACAWHERSMATSSHPRLRGAREGASWLRGAVGRKGKKNLVTDPPAVAAPSARKWLGCREGLERHRGPREALNFFLALFFSCLRTMPAVVLACSLSDGFLLPELWNRLHGRGRGGFQ